MPEGKGPQKRLLEQMAELRAGLVEKFKGRVPGAGVPAEIPEPEVEVPLEEAAEAPGEVERRFTGDKRILEAVARENLAKFKEWLLSAYKVDEERLRRGLGEHFYALISGDVEGYLKLLEENAPIGGEERIRQAIFQNNVPHLKSWLLENYKITGERLRQAFGQAYEHLGFDYAPVPEKPAEKREEKAEEDPLYPEVVKWMIEQGEFSISKLQRTFRLGYGRAMRLVDRMEKEGIVGPEPEKGPRKVLKKPAAEAAPPPPPEPERIPEEEHPEPVRKILEVINRYYEGMTKARGLSDEVKRHQEFERVRDEIEKLIGTPEFPVQFYEHHDLTKFFEDYPLFRQDYPIRWSTDKANASFFGYDDGESLWLVPRDDRYLSVGRTVVLVDNLYELKSQRPEAELVEADFFRFLKVRKPAVLDRYTRLLKKKGELEVEPVRLGK